MEDHIINNIQDENIVILHEIFHDLKRLKITNFLVPFFAESLYKHCMDEKNWSIATGIDKNKYEKKDIPQNAKANALQIKNVNSAFGNDRFSYIFFRSMNGTNMSYFEFSLRKTLNSSNFLNMLNQITGLELTQLTTLFMSKYKSGNYLAPHCDKGNGRLAFVINLTKFWKPQYGGNLHFMNNERTEIIDTFVPGFNNLVIFYVPPGEGIPHYVSHVVSNVKHSRFAISGWFN
jgi:Rps23 Pro-64 3,4-dihydroxylase Tpa1-like proline 4-hydroxylase